MTSRDGHGLLTKLHFISIQRYRTFSNNGQQYGSGIQPIRGVNLRRERQLSNANSTSQKKEGLGEVQVAGKGSPLLIPVIHFSPQIGHHVDVTTISTKYTSLHKI